MIYIASETRKSVYCGSSLHEKELLDVHVNGIPLQQSTQ